MLEKNYNDTESKFLFPYDYVCFKYCISNTSNIFTFIKMTLLYPHHQYYWITLSCSSLRMSVCPRWDKFHNTGFNDTITSPQATIIDLEIMFGCINTDRSMGIMCIVELWNLPNQKRHFFSEISWSTLVSHLSERRLSDLSSPD